MNEANTKALIEAAPTLFRAPEGRSPFALFYFECGDGWFELLLDLARQLEPLAKSAHDVCDGLPAAVQVKEKFGTLRFYLSHGTDEMYALIRDAEERSARTCESCGKPGKVGGRGWLRCSCEECAKP